VSIIGGIVEHGLAPRIASIDFDERGKTEIAKDADVPCFVFLDGISSSTRKLHHVLNALLPPDHLQDVFSRIFAHLDQQIPALFVAAASTAAFSFPSTDAGKYRLLLEVAFTTKVLNGLAGVLPWDFTAINVLERKMDYKFPDLVAKTEPVTEESGEQEEKPDTVADPQTENTAANENGAHSTASAQEQHTTPDNTSDGTEEPATSNGVKNSESDVDTKSTTGVNGNAENGNESVANTAET